jgi:hypothetical protein
VQTVSGFASGVPQSAIEDHFRSALLLAIKQISARDHDLQHFLKTHGLSTQLNSITVVVFGFAAFVFDRRDGPVLKVRALFHPRSQPRMFIIVVGGRPGLRPQVKRGLFGNGFRCFLCEDGLPLVVVAECEQALSVEIQMRREVVESSADLLNVSFVIHFVLMFQLLEVMV